MSVNHNSNNPQQPQQNTDTGTDTASTTDTDYRLLITRLHWYDAQPKMRVLIKPGPRDAHDVTVAGWLFEYLTRYTMAEAWQTLLDQHECHEVLLTLGCMFSIHVQRDPSLLLMKVHEFELEEETPPDHYWFGNNNGSSSSIPRLQPHYIDDRFQASWGLRDPIGSMIEPNTVETGAIHLCVPGCWQWKPGHRRATIYVPASFNTAESRKRRQKKRRAGDQQRQTRQQPRRQQQRQQW